ELTIRSSIIFSFVGPPWIASLCSYSFDPGGSTILGLFFLLATGSCSICIMV
ncbi:hypothetical protein ABKV19_012696, partial [Rosa sericea]